MATEPSSASDKLDRAVIVTGLVVIVGMIMVILDTTIVNVAIDTLSRELDASLSTTQWVITGYLLALGVAVSVAGWAIDRFGVKPVWLCALVLFTIGSALCAVAWSMSALIGCRLLQGLGGGLMMPTAQTILVRAAGPARLGRAMSILGVPMLLGPVFGPVIGGLLVEKVSWHWIFIVNLPIGVFAFWLANRKLTNGGALATPSRFDVVGIVLFAGGFVSVLYGLSEAASRGSFGEASVITWLAVGLTALAAFVGHSIRRGDQAVIDVRLYANRLFSGGSVTIFLVGIALFGGMLLLPLYYQAARGEGALNAGLLLAPQGLGAALVMPIVGRLVDRVGA
ncbi:MAG: DHA2 family efflux MFS transporter permease subunit, partial [Actinomycetia bacterium]|nr:DHA2 family efflux MFS transporter permease subunit [Actinomycetes bacterium]